MKRVVIASVLLSTPVLAADYRDCKELFVSPMEVIAPETKSTGAAWDNGSHADPELMARPAERNDVPSVTIGPKLEDTPKPRWNSIFVDETSTGAWLPVRVGDSVRLSLVDRDAMSDDLMAQYTVEVPKQLATNGVTFVVAGGDTRNPLFLRVSVTDGKRACSGVESLEPLVYELPKPAFIAKVDSALFEKIKAYNRCSVNGASAACKASNYTAVYGDINKDGVPDTIVKGGPFGGGKAIVIAITQGFEPSTRQDVFLGACEDMGVSASGEAACTAEGKTTLISMGNGKAEAREASAKEVEAVSANTAALKAGEAKANLKALFTSQRAFLQEKDRYSANAVELGYSPERGNRYAYFLAARGVIQKRDSAQLLSQQTVNIIAPDTHRHPEAVLPSGLKEAGCPLTFGTNQDGEPVGLGVSGAGAEQHFIAYAIGNVDSDPDMDCWSISDVERKTKSGDIIPAGVPFQERSDYEEPKTATSPTP
ncbi:hypothetical protein [Archangium violaceum]|uniref:hypothetical protein n=1 Tax=Archangium violaceum TaxID=83451 RepID=UPI001361F9C8|nr:hypothetical protein [Archangium violaceum]